jgi:hypothetical protein
MIVISAGMFRSGSTWQYQVACELAASTGGTVRTLGHFEGDQLAERLADGDGACEWCVFKSHDAHPAFADLLADGRAVGLYSYRDLRDVAYSMAHKFAASFHTAAVERGFVDRCLSNDRFWTGQPNVLVQRYEQMFTDPPATVRQIAEHMGLSVTPAAAARVADQFSLEHNRARTAALAAALAEQGYDLTDPANALRYDPKSLLHWNHLRDGSVGRWRSDARPEEVAFLRDRCGAWLIDRGYEADDSWAAGLTDRAAA